MSCYGHKIKWNDITPPADADALQVIFGDFHDSCMREAHLWTDYWVSPELSMSCAAHLDNKIRFLIQRQFRNPSAVELLFEQVTRFNLVPAPENYDSIILAATLLVRDGAIFWANNGEWTPETSNRDEFTWVCAKNLRWREVEWLGKELRYGPKETGGDEGKRG